MDTGRNVGTIDAYLRVALGLVTLTWAGSARSTRWNAIGAVLGAMQVAAGVTRYCPFLQLFGTTTLESVAGQNGRGTLDEYANKANLPDPFFTDL